MRRPPVVLAMAAITALALIVAVALILFSVNPTAHENQNSIRAQQMALTRQVHDLNEIICSQAQTTANAYRFRSLTPSGRVEPIRHFLTRMQAQRQTLELSQGRDCPVAPGFPPFEFQLKRALEQIERILGSFSAQQRKPVDRGVSHNGTPNQLQVSPEFGVPRVINPDKTGNAGIGEEGVPYLPPKEHGKQPGTQPPAAPESIPAEKREEGAPPASPATNEGEAEAGEAPQAAAPTPPPEKGKGPATRAVEAVEEVACSAIREVHELC